MSSDNSEMTFNDEAIHVSDITAREATGAPQHTSTSTHLRGRPSLSTLLQQKGRGYNKPITAFFSPSRKRPLASTPESENDSTPTKRPARLQLPNFDPEDIENEENGSGPGNGATTMEYLLASINLMRDESNSRMDLLNANLLNTLTNSNNNQGEILKAVKQQLDQQAATWDENWKTVNSNIESLKKDLHSFKGTQEDLITRVTALEQNRPAATGDAEMLSSLQQEIRRLRADSEKSLKSLSIGSTRNL